MARRSKYTPALADEIVDGIAAGLTQKDAAIAAGIDPDTLINWKRRYSDFSARVTRAERQRTRLWLGQLWRNAQQGDTKAITELLDRCAPEYRKTTNVNVQHGGRVDHRVTLSAEDHEIAARLAEVRGLPLDEVIAEAEAILGGAV